MYYYLIGLLFVIAVFVLYKNPYDILNRSEDNELLAYIQKREFDILNRKGV
jgi:hypothetical protein